MRWSLSLRWWNKEQSGGVASLSILILGLPLLIGCVTSPYLSSKTEVRDVPFAARGDEEGGLRSRLLIMPVLKEGALKEELLEDIRRYVVRELNRSRQVVLVTHQDLKADPKQFLTSENTYDQEQLYPVVAQTGVTSFLEVKILEVRARRLGDQMGLFRSLKAEVQAKVSLRLIASRNGSELFNETREAKVESSDTRMGQIPNGGNLSENPTLTREAIVSAIGGGLGGVLRSLDKLSWEGRVALGSRERIFVNAGRLSGLQVGDILKISEEGNEIFDPETGRYIGRAPGRMKGTVEVVSYFGKDGAVGVIHSGSGFTENDKVELY